MNSETQLTITTCIKSFPTLPTVVNRVMAITANPKSSASELMSVIQSDVSLTTTILKTSNSAFFGLSQKVSTLDQAITVLGFKEIRNIVIARAVFDSFKQLKSSSKFNIKQFWEHSFVCGLAAKVIAKDLNYPGSEFFIAGLIHDIGKLVMYMTSPNQYTALVENAKNSGTDEQHLEKDIFGITHDDVGMKLLERWQFPDNLIFSVGFHHRLDRKHEGLIFSLIIHVADIIAHLSEVSSDDSDEVNYLQSVFYPQILQVTNSHNIKWSESDVTRLLDELDTLKSNEADALRLFTA